MAAVRFLLLSSVFVLLAGSLRAQEQPGAYDEGVLKNAGLKTDDAALLDYFRKHTLSESDQARVIHSVRQLGARSFAVRERVTAELIKEGRTVRRFLRTALHDPDPEIARRAEICLGAIDLQADAALPLAASHLLALRRPAGATEAVLNYLPFADDESLEEELLTDLMAIASRQDRAGLETALKDRWPIRRAAAARVLGRWEEARMLVRPLLADPDSQVRLRAAQGLLEGKDREAVAALLGLLTDSPMPMAWSAEEMLCRVAGDQAPAVTLGAGKEGDRRQCREGWQKWWREHESTVDLTRIVWDQRLLGLTLIVTLDGTDQGKVWEVGSDGRPRWEIKSVQGPIDARVLPGNRVLIAEYYGKRVTERDWHGKVLWEHRVPSRPVAVQRLPNGNTLIASNSVIEEVRRDNQVVFTHTPKHGSIASVQKLRTGNIIYVTYNGQFVELDGKGTEVRRFAIPQAASGLFTVEALLGGRMLIPLTMSNKIVEVDAAGKAAWEVACKRPNAATRLPNGNILTSSMDDRRVTEIDRTGKVVWEQKLDGRPFRVRRR